MPDQTDRVAQRVDPGEPGEQQCEQADHPDADLGMTDGGDVEPVRQTGQVIVDLPGQAVVHVGVGVDHEPGDREGQRDQGKERQEREVRRGGGEAIPAVGGVARVGADRMVEERAPRPNPLGSTGHHADTRPHRVPRPRHIR